MNLKRLITFAAATAALGIGAAASAADILCKTVVNEHMLVSDAYVTACVDAGIGNIGNGVNDDFLNKDLDGAGSGTTRWRDTYSDVGDGTFTTVDNAGGLGSTGTFNFDSSLWSTYTGLSIGFKVGTGGEADEWFIYTLKDLVSAGNWTFVENTRSGGSGMSHISLYATGRCTGGECGGLEVPEPGSLALIGAAMAGLALIRRRRRD